MNQNLKRILPILLAILVLCSIVWYLFIYDMDFTRDVLVEYARRFEEKGNHTLAAWLYDRAYVFSGASDEVAIELAQQFVSIGNYTKAERTLTQAIADGGSVELYVALCNTYVQQDKLKDAVTMLENVTDPAIKAELDAMRPAAPAADKTPGFYSQYETVTLKTESGTLYYTTDLTYPSINTTPGSAAFTLSGGENTIRALTVGENGLVSSLAVFGYTVKGVIEPVTLQDSALDAVIRQKLQLSGDATLYTRDLWAVTELAFPANAASSMDLALMPYIQILTVEGSSVSGWESLSSLTELTQLTMKGCTLTAKDVAAIGNLPKLEKLTLSGCSLSSIEGLSGAKKATYLDLSDNTIRNLEPLSFLSGLTYLDLNHNALDNLSALSSLTNLQHLNVSYNSLISAAPLSACTGMLELNLQNNTIASLSGLEGMSQLTMLNASYNVLTDAAPIAGCTALTELNISNNQLSDIACLSGLTAIQYLNFSRNAVTALPAFAASSPLVTVDGSYNKVTSVSGLANLHHLNKVLMDYNSISSVNTLADCHSLSIVSVYGNPVSDVSALTASGIIVTYTPKT